MEINVTVTKKQIFDYITTWNHKDILDFIRDIDEGLDNWEFTIKLWLYLDKVIKECMDDYKLESLVKQLSAADI